MKLLSVVAVVESTSRFLEMSSSTSDRHAVGF